MRGERGSILVHVVIAIPVTLFAILGTAAVIVSTSRQQAQNKATTVAVAALREKVAEIQALANTDIGVVYATYNATAGRHFDVPAIPGVRAGLVPPSGQAHVGTVLVWNDETGNTRPSGSRAGDSQSLGLPLDLNMDDDANDANLLSFDMKVVPLKIVLEFVDSTGPRRMEAFYLAAAQPQ